MNTILSRIFKFMKGLLIDSILAIVFAVLLIIIFKNYIWVEGQTFEQWYLQISGCDLTNSKGDPKCLITNMSVCWHCAIFDQIWNIMNFVAYKFYDFFTKITLIIIAFSFAFWLLIEMTFKKFVKSASPAPDTLSPKDYWKTVFKQILKIIFAITLILSLRISGAIKYAMEPVFSVGTYFAKVAIRPILNTESCNKLTVKKDLPKFIQEMLKDEKQKIGFTNTDLINANTDAYQTNIKNEISCMLWSIQTTILTGISAGETLILGKGFNIFDKLAGLGVLIVFFLLGIKTAFWLIDIIISFGLFLMFTPFIIGSFAYGKMFKLPDLWGKVSGYLINTAFYIFAYSFAISVLYLSFYYITDSLYVEKTTFYNVYENNKIASTQTKRGSFNNHEQNAQNLLEILTTGEESGFVPSQGFGGRINPVTGEYQQLHTGIDIKMREGTPVPSAANGTVIHISNHKIGGNQIFIDHGNGYVTKYLHLQKFGKYKVGDKVNAGETIGYVGSTGRSTGPHLHYTVTFNNEYVDPMKVRLKDISDPNNANLTPEQFENIPPSAREYLKIAVPNMIADELQIQNMLSTVEIDDTITANNNEKPRSIFSPAIAVFLYGLIALMVFDILMSKFVSNFGIFSLGFEDFIKKQINILKNKINAVRKKIK